MADKIAIYQRIFPQLTPRQREVLVDFSLGMTTSQMQQKANCSRQAIERHLADIKETFECHSSSEIRVIFLNTVLLSMLHSINNVHNS